MNPYWSYVLTAVGVFGLFLAGRKDRRGWMVGIFAQTLWFAYAISTRQWGFLVSCFAYGWVYIKNARAWRPDRHGEDVDRKCSTNVRSESTVGSTSVTEAVREGRVKPEWVPLRRLGVRKRGGKW
jgi:hypothetical protein